MTKLFTNARFYDLMSFLLGILCGECTEGNGMTVLLNGCTSCNTSYVSLIPLLSMLNFF